MDILKFITAGSVDDGKSTLIGRLLYDSNAVFQDHLDAIEKSSGKIGEENLNLALLTDGLKAEREQGITIDVAYKYFSTPRRKFIIADAPGHIQYTRNMVTGASKVNLAIIIIDARQGVVEQTNRHSYISSLLRIPHIVVCVNKMDLVDYSREVFEKIEDDYRQLAAKLGMQDVEFIPVSALKGDNIVNKSQKMEWFLGRPLLSLLEEIHIESDENLRDGRFPVQYIIRPQTPEHHDYRGYAGQIKGGVFRTGDRVKILPSGFETEITGIDYFDKKLEEAFAPMSVVLHFADDYDIGRGDMIVPVDNQPKISQELTGYITWMDSVPLEPGKKYLLQHTTNRVRAAVKEIDYGIDIETFEKNLGKNELKLNEIGRVKIHTAKPVFVDDYSINRSTGSAILIDEATNNTVGAFICRA